MLTVETMDYIWGGGQKLEAIIILRTVYMYDVPWFVFWPFSLLSAAKSAVALCLHCALIRPYDIVEGVVLV